MKKLHEIIINREIINIKNEIYPFTRILKNFNNK